MINKLKPAEQAEVDRNRMTEIGLRLGPTAADELISRVMEELAVLLARVHRAFEKGHMHEVRASANKIHELSEHVGMLSLARVSTDLCRLADIGDHTAMAAVTGRMSRIGERSLMAVWDLQDLSG